LHDLAVILFPAHFTLQNDSDLWLASETNSNRDQEYSKLGRPWPNYRHTNHLADGLFRPKLLPLTQVNENLTLKFWRVNERPITQKTQAFDFIVFLLVLNQWIGPVSKDMVNCVGALFHQIGGQSAFPPPSPTQNSRL